MESLTTKLFDAIARTIYSLGLVTFVMLFVIASMIFFSHTLFLDVFPDSMATWEKNTATWLMALGWEMTVLVTICNPKHINKAIPVVLAIASAFIILFFIQAFDFRLEPLTLVQRWFVGVLAGTINFIYARLFHRKWMERNELAALPAKLKESERLCNEVQSKLDQLTRTFNDRDATLVELRSALKERDRDLKQLQAKLDEFHQDVTCPYCRVVQRDRGALIAHKGHCEKNPKNLKKTLS